MGSLLDIKRTQLYQTTKLVWMSEVNLISLLRDEILQLSNL